MPQDHSPSHTQSHDDPTVPLNRSSSSSSNNASSEPSIDYSSWSPRSYQLSSLPAYKWIPKSNSNNSHASSPFSSPQIDFPTMLRKTSLSQTTCKLYKKATGNPIAICNPTSIRTYSLTIANPIAINPLCSLSKAAADSRNVGTTQKNPTLGHLFTMSPVQIRHNGKGMLSLCLAEIYCSPTEVILTAYIKQILDVYGGPSFRPKKLIDSFIYQAHSKDLYSSSIQFCPSTLSNINRPKDLTKNLGGMACYMMDSCLKAQRSQPIPNPSLITRYLSETYLFSPCSTAPASKNTLSMFPKLFSCLNPSLPSVDHQMDSYASELAVVMALNTTNNPQTLIDSYHPDGEKELQQKRGKKAQQKPTRRSLRIQEKRQTDSAKPQRPNRAKKQMNTLSFDLDFSPNSAPLDTVKALEILQASGLEINNTVEEMIEEAVRKDYAASTPDQAPPTTPLHDPVPPREVPELDFLL